MKSSESSSEEADGLDIDSEGEEERRGMRRENAAEDEEVSSLSPPIVAGRSVGSLTALSTGCVP